jgi:hypothetical protein
MQSIEFESISDNGIIKIPEHYQEWFQKPVKVILLAMESIRPKKSHTNDEVKNFFENIQIDLSGYHFNRDEANER